MKPDKCSPIWLDNPVAVLEEDGEINYDKGWKQNKKAWRVTGERGALQRQQCQDKLDTAQPQPKVSWQAYRTCRLSQGSRSAVRPGCLKE
eukprot:g45154.t1